MLQNSSALALEPKLRGKRGPEKQCLHPSSNREFNHTLTYTIGVRYCLNNAILHFDHRPSNSVLTTGCGVSHHRITARLQEEDLGRSLRRESKAKCLEPLIPDSRHRLAASLGLTFTEVPTREV